MMKSYPDFSVIVPVYEQWEMIPPLLECLGAQTLSQHLFEVILVDNGSTRFAPPQELPEGVQVYRCVTPGSYAARNYGVQKAVAPWLAFIDADCRPRRDWLATLREAALTSSSGGCLFAGRVEVTAGEGRTTRYGIYDVLKGIPQEIYVARGYAATANLLVPRCVFESLGGFDEGRFSGGDADFCRRARRAGACLRFVAGACVSHSVRTSRAALVLKARRIKGAQVSSGGLWLRLGWFVRTFLPPVHLYARYLRTVGCPMKHRLAAVVVQSELWVVEIVEAVRVYILGRQAERR